MKNARTPQGGDFFYSPKYSRYSSHNGGNGEGKEKEKK